MVRASGLANRTSWFLLILFFTFDNFFSYYAVTRLGGHEANLVIAPIVEKYPLLYFLCIPLQTIVIYWIIKFLVWLSSKIFHQSKKFFEPIIPAALTIYWLVGNTSMNLAFFLGHRQPAINWLYTTIIGVLLSLVYFLIRLFSHPT